MERQPQPRFVVATIALLVVVMPLAFAVYSAVMGWFAPAVAWLVILVIATGCAVLLLRRTSFARDDPHDA